MNGLPQSCGHAACAAPLDGGQDGIRLFFAEAPALAAALFAAE